MFSFDIENKCIKCEPYSGSSIRLCFFFFRKTQDGTGHFYKILFIFQQQERWLARLWFISHKEFTFCAYRESHWRLSSLPAYRLPSLRPLYLLISLRCCYNWPSPRLAWWDTASFQASHTLSFYPSTLPFSPFNGKRLKVFPFSLFFC